MDEQQYLIHEVAELAGVSTRTIRYYISEGLLPPPTTRGRYAYYDPAYIDLIRLIRQLKDSYLPLREIKMLVQNPSPERVQELLQASTELRRLQIETGFDTSAAQDASGEDTAAGYITNVLRHKLVNRVMEERQSYKKMVEFEPDTSEPEEILPAAASMDKPAFLRRNELTMRPSQNMEELDGIAHEISARKPGLVPRKGWKRYEIMEGVEIGIRDDVERRSGGKLADIILTIRQMFKLI